MKDIELEFSKQSITIYCKKEEIGTIHWKTNPFHNQNYYLDIDFVSPNVTEAVFKEIATWLKKPLQVMISSEEKEKIAFLESAGFVCKRKCYETEAEKQDYIGETCDGKIRYSFAGQDTYRQCCELMLERYCLLHQNINPWTGSRDDFFKELPEVWYDEKYTILTNDTMELKLIHFDKGNDVEIPFYWYEIIPKEVNKPVGKISIRLGDNYHSYYNGHIGYEVDEEYRGHGYSFRAAKLVLQVAKAYGMEYIYLVCDEDNAASYKTIEKLGAKLVELVVPPEDYFGWYEGIPAQRIYELEL